MENLINEAVEEGTDESELGSDASQAVIDATNITAQNIDNIVGDTQEKIINKVTGEA